MATYCWSRSPVISPSILKNEIRLLFPAPFAPIKTFRGRSQVHLLIDLNPLRMTRLSMAMICPPTCPSSDVSGPESGSILLEIDPLPSVHRLHAPASRRPPSGSSEVMMSSRCSAGRTVRRRHGRAGRERVEVAGDVEDAHRLVVEPSGPAQGLEELLEGPDAAGQRKERVGAVGPSAPCAGACRPRRAARSGRRGRSPWSPAVRGSRRSPGRRRRGPRRRRCPSGRRDRRRRQGQCRDRPGPCQPAGRPRRIPACADRQ